MTFLTFVFIVILLIWISRLNNRLTVIERKLGDGATSEAAPEEKPEPQTISPRAPKPSAEIASEPAFEFTTASATHLLTKIGIVALLFGVGFFLKYAIDQGWISIWMRLLLGAAVGGLMIVLGELWKEQYSRYAQSLTGGGLAMLYFVVYAGYQFYHVMEQPAAFLIMIGITVLGIVLSYRYDSKGLAALAVFGGYFSPIMLHSNENHQTALFSYITVLNVGVVLMLFRRFWFELLYISLFKSVILFSLWAASYSTQANTLNSMIFLILNFLLVFILSALMFRRAHEQGTLPKEGPNYIGMFYFLASTAFLIISTWLLYYNFQQYLPPVMFLAGITAFIVYAIIDRLEYQGINYALSLAGSIFLALAVWWQFTGRTVDAYLLALSAMGVGAGLLQRRKDIRVWGLFLLFGTIIKILGTEYDSLTHHFLFNTKFASALAATAILLGTAWAYKKSPVDEDERIVPELVRLAATAVVWLIISMEIWTCFGGGQSDNARNLLLSVWWMAYAVILAILGSVTRYSDLRKAAAALFCLSIAKVFLYDVQALELAYRVVSFIVLGVILLGVSFGYQKNKERIQQFLSSKQ